ncbi:hypothetical protein FK535_18170 [Mycolicibacterium sp. 018/SC-01/001]|uniref:hypothetical protein n=1 Tax=Mycolicibacterium sp. 018/SC-01/001 TaxID=2592069 RepID=UPI00118104F6|nr:hypothetical protein [Mycolicibacterium sp. 018/SC-01/001]TRW80986.1 hypothetical protein FK535_18170 [Mycolicibacterium sp. 018/SC-01/001]
MQRAAVGNRHLEFAAVAANIMGGNNNTAETRFDRSLVWTKRFAERSPISPPATGRMKLVRRINGEGGTTTAVTAIKNVPHT